MTTLVFPTAATAARWMRAREDTFEIRQVLSEAPFTWVESRGTITDLQLADQAYQLYPDHRFPEQANGIFLAPRELEDAR